jgi:hypothetical protein
MGVDELGTPGTSLLGQIKQMSLLSTEFWKICSLCNVSRRVKKKYRLFRLCVK